LIGIVIVAHGGLGKEYLAAVEHVIGHQDGIVAVSIEAECNRTRKQDEICTAVDGVDQGDGVIVAVDMFGGSPSNLSMKACNCSARRIVYGVNLPMLVKLARSRTLPIEKAIEIGVQSGRKYMSARGGSNAV